MIQANRPISLWIIEKICQSFEEVEGKFYLDGGQGLISKLCHILIFIENICTHIKYLFPELSSDQIFVIFTSTPQI